MYNDIVRKGMVKVRPGKDVSVIGVEYGVGRRGGDEAARRCLGPVSADWQPDPAALFLQLPLL